MTKLDEFVADVAKSGLLTRDEVDRMRAGLPADWLADDPRRLARVLVKAGRLTPYQARKILSGATRGFFLGGYRILRQLGEGGMGKVFLAVKDSDGRRVAIKVLPPKKAIEEANSLARFRREMEISRKLRHPNIALTLDVGEADGAHFMVMEYVKGRSLYELVRRHGPLEVPVAADYFLKVLDGLNAAHDAGLIHRDVKPSNLMMTADGDAKILDLGLARHQGDDSGLTKTNVILGTLDYASPEQLGDAARADRRSDLYSLGCTMYFALAGYPPFDGGDLINKIYRHRMEDPPPLDRAAKNVPEAFAAIVHKLLAKRPEDRYRTGREVQTDLSPWTDPAVVETFLLAENETENDPAGRSGLDMEGDYFQPVDHDAPHWNYEPRADPRTAPARIDLDSISADDSDEGSTAFPPRPASSGAIPFRTHLESRRKTPVILIALLLISLFLLLIAMLF